MAQLSIRTSLAANASVNLLAGSQYEFLPPKLYPRGAYVEFGNLADATGVLGGDTLRPDGSVLQVILLDDHSRTGYPTPFTWHLGFFQAPTAALFSWIAIRNEDPVPRRSIVTVDLIRWQTNVNGNVALNV